MAVAEVVDDLAGNVTSHYLAPLVSRRALVSADTAAHTLSHADMTA